jgi:hypothetical protein
MNQERKVDLKIIMRFSFLFILGLLYSGKVFSQENSDCLMCHEDKTLKGTKSGRTISVFVNEKIISSSVHSEVNCIQCHVDLEGSDFPHAENVKRAACNSCHETFKNL